MDYRAKLEQFNDTEKYQKEMDFMRRIMNLNKNEKALDYGCGTGTMVKYLREWSDVFGYDIKDYTDDEYLFRREFFFKFHKIYFMHSFAHIERLEERLINLKQFATKETEIFILTPNLSWLQAMSEKEYIPDPTVIQHFTSDTLKEVIEKNKFKIIDQGQIGDVVNNQHERLWIRCAY